MINLYVKFEVPIFIRCGNTKDNAKCEKHGDLDG